MKKVLLLAFLVLFSVSLLPAPILAQASCTVSGYILDSNGHGLGGANIIFCVPDTVPSVCSDSSGYYSISAPAGTYHLMVWPPFDSNNIYYDEPGFNVASGMTKNITLPAGCKVSGYIVDSSGTPVYGGIVVLNNYLSGWFSTATGYYFVSAPTGTYTLTAKPRSGYNHFPTYTESNFTVNCDTSKNITLTGPMNVTAAPPVPGSPSPVQTPKPTASQSPTPTSKPTPTQTTPTHTPTPVQTSHPQNLSGDFTDDFSSDSGLWTLTGMAYRDPAKQYMVLTNAEFCQTGRHVLQVPRHRSIHG